MASHVAATGLALHDPPSNAVLWQWLYREIRAAILSGRLKRGVCLPSTRELGRKYGLSRGTVIAAFDQLQAEGYLDGKVGAGTYVNTRLPEDYLTTARATIDDQPVRPRKIVTLSRFANRLIPVPEMPVAPLRAFRLEPALDEFPTGVWGQIVARCMRRATRTLLVDSDSRGYRPLREAIAEHLGATRGVACSADQVIVVAGIQHGFDLTMRLLLNPQDRVCVEDPCHPMIPAMLRVLPARVIPVPVDTEGLDTRVGQRQCRGPKLIYVTPAHQFPLGVTMTLERRLALLDWARRSGSWIFEDDYDSEYRYTGRPIPAVQGFDPEGPVIFSGSFSKLLLPTLRLGYLVVPSMLVDKFAAARFISDRHSSIIDQAVMCEFLVEGHFARHIRRMRELHVARSRELRETVNRRLPEVMEVPEIEAGIHTVVWLKHELREEAVAQAAAEHKVETVPLRRFALRRQQPDGLLLGFAAYTPRQIRDAVDRLAVSLNR